MGRSPWRSAATMTLLATFATACASSAETTATTTEVPSTGPPTTIVATTIDPVTTPRSTSNPPDRSSTVDRVRVTTGAPGVLATVRIDDRDWFGASGTADLAGSPITATTRFRIASITKPIVAALVLDAVTRGELSLDDVVGDLLPGVVRADPPITVRMLLDHTSGVFDYGNEGDPLVDIQLLTDDAVRIEAQELIETYMRDGTGIASDRLIVALAETHDRYFEPGTGYRYSNPNYQLAAMVLQQVTGRPLARLLEERILGPLGLEHTTIAPPDLGSPELRGYGTSVDDGSLVDVTDDLLAFGNGGNGGIVSTAGELLTIIQAIVSGRLLTPDLVAEMSTPTPQSGSTYGLGLATYTLTCGTFLGHEGGVNGTASIALVTPDGTDGVVVALNLRDGTDPHLPRIADELICR